MSVVELGPATVDLTGVYAGEPNPITLHLHHSGVAINLAGYSFAAQVRPFLGSPDIALTAIITVVDEDNGDISVEWDGDEIRDLMTEAEDPTTSWSGVWDLEIDNGSPETVVAGKFKAKLDVTQ